MWFVGQGGGKNTFGGGQYGRIYSNIKSTYLNIHKIPFFSLSLRKQLHMCPESCTRWFTVALFTKEHWELPKCLGTEEWLNKPNIVRQSTLYSSSKEQTRDIYQQRDLCNILGSKMHLAPRYKHYNFLAKPIYKQHHVHALSLSWESYF